MDETRELLNRARNGGADALQSLLEQHRPRLLARIRLMMGDQARRCAESGDFLQNVFVKILAELERFEPRDQGAFLRWATEIARNQIRLEVRRKRESSLERFYSNASGSLFEADGTSPSTEASNHENVMRMIEALEELPESQQRVIELRSFEQLPFAEVAQQLDRSVNAVRLLHTRAVTRLGEVLRRA